jgi:hypothetical protein
MKNHHIIILIASVMFLGCKDRNKEPALEANQNTATKQDNTAAETSVVTVTPIDTKPTEGSLASNSAKKSYIQSRLGQVLFEIDGNRIRSRMGQIMFEIDGNRIKARSGQTICTIDGNRIRSRMGQVMYEIDGNRIKARSGQTVCTIDGHRVRSRMGQTIFTMRGSVPLKTIALLIGAGALNLD